MLGAVDSIPVNLQVEVPANSIPVAITVDTSFKASHQTIRSDLEAEPERVLSPVQQSTTPSLVTFISDHRDEVAEFQGTFKLQGEHSFYHSFTTRSVVRLCAETLTCS